MYRQEIKGNLARLLATENLVVEHRKVSTASFNVETRVLTLPKWDKASETVYDLLVGHEVGHALYTPSDRSDWDSSIPMDYYNVVEDARIEKMIKRRYPGLARDFFRGYTELNEDDFFQTEGKNLIEYNLIDRLNLHFKIGSFALVPFEDDETQFIDMISEAETFADVTVVCKMLVDFIKQKQKEKIDNIPDQDQTKGNTQSNTEVSRSGTEEKSEEGESDDQQKHSSNDFSGGATDNIQSFPPEFSEELSETQRAFDQNAQDLNDTNSWSGDTVYVERAKLFLDKIVVPFRDLHPYIEASFADQQQTRGKAFEVNNIFEHADQSFIEYKADAQKEVNYLVKEFECKKSADAYARASVSKTGVLNTSKLHTYKYNDDLFKKVTILPEGKNHGMIFILDWSGSMTNILDSTVKQLINLAWFCRKVQIPFEVYAFTYEWHSCFLGQSDSIWDEEEAKHKREHNKLGVHEKFSLLNLISSSAKTKDFDKSILNLWRLSCYHGRSFFTDKFHAPQGLDLSGTPLNDAVLSLHEIIPDFKKRTGSQKINICILTDGESSLARYDVNLERYGSDYIGVRTFDDGQQLRDRKLGITYSPVNGHYATEVFLKNVKDNFPEVNLIGFRIGTTSDFTSAYKHYNLVNYVSENDMKKWKKERSWEFNYVGYDSHYYIANNNLCSNTSFDVDDDASKAQITKAFKTMLKSKTTNKKVLSSFAQLVS